MELSWKREGREELGGCSKVLASAVQFRKKQSTTNAQDQHDAQFLSSKRQVYTKSCLCAKNRSHPHNMEIQLFVSPPSFHSLSSSCSNLPQTVTLAATKAAASPALAP